MKPKTKTREYPAYLCVILVTGMGAFMAALDIGIINIALPYLQAYFHAPLTTVAWAITTYTLMLTSLMILCGKLSDVYGRRPMFQAGVALFIIASVFCGLAPTALILLITRALQGVGAAMIQATAVALITSNLPKNAHAKGISTYSTLLGMGNIVGVSVGGIILYALGWQWIFYINVPVGLLVFWGSFYLLNDNKRAEGAGIDYLGILLLAVSILLLLLGIESLAHPATASAFAYYILGFVLGFGLFSLHEYHTKSPLIDFAYFLNKPILALSLGTITFGLTLAIYLAVPPLYLKRTTHLASWVIGLITLSGPIGYVISSKMTSRLMPFFNVKTIILLGELTIIIAMSLLYAFQWQLPLYAFSALLCIIGAGGGLLFTATVVAFMAYTPEAIHGIAGAYSRMLHSFGLALGAAMTAMLIQKAKWHGLPKAGFDHVWLFGILFTLASIVFFMLVTMQAASSEQA